MSLKVSNDFSTHTRKDSCRSNNCVSACLCCANANRHSVLSCRRSLIRPMIVPHSCAWQKPSRHFLPACAALQRRLASLNVRKSCACWLKTFWSAKIRLRFVTAFPFPRAHLKTKDRALQKAEITFCVRGVVSPLLSNILLTPFDQEMRRKGYQLTRYADDWVVTCESAAEARAAVAAALRILNELGVQLHPQKTRIVHVRQGFEFLGYKIKRGQRQLQLPPGMICSGAQSGALYAFPREKSIRHFMDQVRALTSRRVPLRTTELIKELNPVLRGWGHHYKRDHVRKLFHRLDGWIVRRIRSHRCGRWRNGGWRQLPETKLYGEYGLVNLVQLIPSIAFRKRESS